MVACSCFEWLRFAQQKPRSNGRESRARDAAHDLQEEFRSLSMRFEALSRDAEETKRRNEELEQRVQALEETLSRSNAKRHSSTQTAPQEDRAPGALSGRLDRLRPPPLLLPKDLHAASPRTKAIQLREAEECQSYSSDEEGTDCSSCSSGVEVHFTESWNDSRECLNQAAAALGFELPFDATVFDWLATSLANYTITDAQELVADFCPTLSDEEVAALVGFFQDGSQSPAAEPDNDTKLGGGEVQCGSSSHSRNHSSCSRSSSTSSSCCSSPDSFDLFDVGKGSRSLRDRLSVGGLPSSHVRQVRARFPQIDALSDEENDASSSESETQ